MLYFQEEVFNRLENRKIVIAGIKKGAQLVSGLLYFKGYETSYFLDIWNEDKVSVLNGVPVVNLKEVSEFENDIIIFASEVLNNNVAMELERRGYCIKDVYNMVEFTKGKIPQYLFKAAQLSIEQNGGYWEHSRSLFESGINILEGGISKCIFSDGLLIIDGWLLPRCNFQEIKVFVDNAYIGEAQLHRERKDIKKRYPIYNEDNAGFYLQTSICPLLKKNSKVIIYAYNEDKIVWERSRTLTNTKIENIVVELLRKQEHNKLLDIVQKYISIGDNISILKYFLDYYLRVSNDCYEKINIYQLIYQLGFFNSAYMEEYIKEINRVKDVWTKLWLREQDIPWMVLYHPELAVPSIYSWEREVMLQVVEQLRKEKNICQMPDRYAAKTKNVAIVVEGLADEKAASSIFELGIANEMARKGYSVTVYVLDSSYFEKEIKTNTFIKRKRNSSVNREYHLKELISDVSVWYCRGKSLAERLESVIETIQESMPEFIIDISLGGTVAASIFYKNIPIIHIPLTGYSSGAVFDRYIAKNKYLCMQENKVFHSIEEDRIYEAPINIPYNTRQRKIYYRNDYGFETTDFILITVGNRLQYEMDIKFIQTIKKLLEENKRYKWIIVGNELKPELYQISGEMIDNGQIKLWGIEDDLIALYKMCNVYVNPDRAGGCGSMELAMRIKMPIALTDFPSDIIPIIGVKNCCGSSYMDIAHYIQRLYKNPLFYKMECEKFYLLLKNKKFSMEHYTGVIIEAYKNVR